MALNGKSCYEVSNYHHQDPAQHCKNGFAPLCAARLGRLDHPTQMVKVAARFWNVVNTKPLAKLLYGLLCGLACNLADAVFAYGVGNVRLLSCIGVDGQAAGCVSGRRDDRPGIKTIIMHYFP